MKKIYCALILGLTSFAFTQQNNATIDVNGVSRDFIYYEPPIYSTAGESVPVLFVFHGLGDNAANMAQAGFNLIADTANMIPVYMQGLNNVLSQSAWNNGTALASTADDLAFIDQVLDSIETWYNIDPDRIYACGFSMGGIMSYHLLCANNEFDAIGSVGGPMATSDISGCQRTNPSRTVHIHGTADATAPYDGTALPSLSLVPETMDFWKNYTGCQDSTICRITDSANDSINVDWIQYNQCNTDHELELYRMNGAGHIWPYPPANDIWAAKVIWNFLEGQPTGYGCTSIVGLQEEKSFPFEVYPNPSSTNLNVKTKAEINEIQIQDISGKIVQTFSNLKTNIFSFSIQNLETGTYFIKVNTDKGLRIQKIIKE